MKKKLSVFLALLMIVSMLAACGGGTTPEPAPDDANKDRIVHMAVNAVWPSFDPMETNAIITLEVINNIYEPLVFYDYDNDGKIVNVLAESYTVDDAGTTWTFKIRQGVKFHNGETLTADDVVFSVQRAMNSAILATRTDGIVSVEKTADDTVVIKTDVPRAAFIPNLAYIYIVNQKFTEEHNGSLSQDLCGTGPYKVDSVDISSKIAVSQFEDYWGTPGTIKGATWDVITDTATQSMALEGHDLDLISVAHSLYGEFENKEGFKTAMVPTFHTVWVCFNSNKAPFDDVRVRQAMCYLINNEEVAVACFEGLCQTDGVMLNRNIAGLPSWDRMKQYDYEYNPEKGLELLREAGYDTTKEIDLGEIISYAEGHYITKACPVIQADLAKYNIKLKINAMETNAFAAQLYAGDYTMAMAGGAWGGDASMYYQIFGSAYKGTTNFLWWGDPECDECFEKAAVELDPAKRADLYERAIQIMQEAAPGKSVGHKYNTYAYTEELVPVMRMNQYFLTEWKWA